MPCHLLRFVHVAVFHEKVTLTLRALTRARERASRKRS